MTSTCRWPTMKDIRSRSRAGRCEWKFLQGMDRCKRPRSMQFRDFRAPPKIPARPGSQFFVPRPVVHLASVARQTYQLLVQSGISPGMISQKTYPGPSKAPVQLTYIRSVAVTKECGDWSTDLATTSNNEVHQNYGCAVQNNIAAMVVNPDDFVAPRPTTPAYAAARTPGVLSVLPQAGSASTAASSSVVTTTP